MSPTLLSTLALLFVSYTQNVNASFRMSGANLVTARVDPLVSPGGVASHVHSVVGGNNFGATYDYKTLRQSSCSSVEVQEDKSNYWAPVLYYKHRDTGKFELVPTTGWAVYYLHRHEDGERIVQFPEGFRMIGGSANSSGVNATDDNDGFKYHCRTDGSDPKESPTLPKQACNEIRIQAFFPSCWNGVDVTSADFKSHVAQPVNGFEKGPCPASHPVRLMSVFLEQFADTGKFEYYDGAFVMSTGDNVGYSDHADFTNGWDASEGSLLQQAIETCTNPSASIDACDVLKPHRSDVYKVCHPANKLPVEDIGIFGGLDKLPGDNPIWGGDVPKKPTGVTNNPPWGFGPSILPDGWEPHGCIDEGNSGGTSLNGDRFSDPLMSAGLCLDHCDKEGYTLAGVENKQDCGCAKEFTQGGTDTLIDPWNCWMLCPGNMYENCGSSGKINLYKKTGAHHPPSKYPAVGSNFTTVYTNDGTSSPSLVTGMNTTLVTTQQPSNSTSGSNDSTTPTSAAPSMTTSSATTPSVAPAVSTPSTTMSPSVAPAATTSSTTTSPSVAPDVSTPSTTTSPSVAPDATTPPMTTSSAAPAVNTPPTTSPAATLPVCHKPKTVKRVPSFLKREPLEEFHVPARHRRRHH